MGSQSVHSHIQTGIKTDHSRNHYTFHSNNFSFDHDTYMNHRKLFFKKRGENICFYFSMEKKKKVPKNMTWSSWSSWSQNTPHRTLDLNLLEIWQGMQQASNLDTTTEVLVFADFRSRDSTAHLVYVLWSDNQTAVGWYHQSRPIFFFRDSGISGGGGRGRRKNTLTES